MPCTQAIVVSVKLLTVSPPSGKNSRTRHEYWKFTVRLSQRPPGRGRMACARQLSPWSSTKSRVEVPHTATGCWSVWYVYESGAASDCGQASSPTPPCAEGSAYSTYNCSFDGFVDLVRRRSATPVNPVLVSRRTYSP